jgi:acetyltransferase-like isoleucine patch superfamily enzyme
MSEAQDIPGLAELLDALSRGERIPGSSPHHAAMHAVSQAALRVTGDLNGGYHEPAEVRLLLSELWGESVAESVTVFPPFRTDFGRNTHVGQRVFINSGCVFQDQGGVFIGDDVLIGHNVVLATLNHDMDPARRADMIPAPIRIGQGAWLGSNVTVLPGVTIGAGAVVAAASVVTRDVQAGTVVVGSPARVQGQVPSAGQ